MKEIKYDELLKILNEKNEYALNEYKEHTHSASGSYYLGYYDMIGELIEYFNRLNDTNLDNKDGYTDYELLDRITSINTRINDLIEYQKSVIEKLDKQMDKED